MSNKQITVMAFPKAKPGNEDALLACLQSLVTATRQEAGCIDFHLHRHSEDATRFSVYENFADQAALDAHMEAPHTKAFFQYLKDSDSSVEYEFWSMQSNRPE